MKGLRAIHFEFDNKIDLSVLKEKGWFWVSDWEMQKQVLGKDGFYVSVKNNRLSRKEPASVHLTDDAARAVVELLISDLVFLDRGSSGARAKG